MCLPPGGGSLQVKQVVKLFAGDELKIGADNKMKEVNFTEGTVIFLHEI